LVKRKRKSRRPQAQKATPSLPKKGQTESRDHQVMREEKSIHCPGRGVPEAAGDESTLEKED